MAEYDYQSLMNNLMYVIKEGQMKVGYTENAATLNYPHGSLCRLLGREMNGEELSKALEGFASYAAPALGQVEISRYDGQYCLTVPAEGVRYVHEQVADSPFLRDLIEAVKAHKVKRIEDVLRIFQRYGQQVVCEKTDGDGYDHVVYFADGKPDNFVYLFETAFGHVSYHRMTKDDYQAEIKY